MPTDGAGGPTPRARFDVLPRTTVVLRLVTIHDKFLPNGPDDLPVGEVFVPTDSDKKEAAERGARVLVSVWEHGVTTEEEASNIRRADAAAAGRPAPEFVPRWFFTSAIEDAGPERLRVLHDPRPEEDGPGALGHAGIAGLERVPQEPKHIWRAMLDRVATSAKRSPHG